MSMLRINIYLWQTIDQRSITYSLSQIDLHFFLFSAHCNCRCSFIFLYILCVCVLKCHSFFCSFSSIMIVCLLFVVVVSFRKRPFLPFKNNIAHTHIKYCLIYSMLTDRRTLREKKSCKSFI
jgi:hypothetical protein